MKDPERLNVSGTEEERRLLRAAQSVRVPERTREEVRRAVEARMAVPRKRRWFFAGAGLLVATTAVAASLPVWRALQNPQSPPASGSVLTGTDRPIIVPLPAPATKPIERAPEPGPVRPQPQPQPAPEARPQPIENPALDLEGFRRGLAVPAPPPAAPPPGPSLRIRRSNRAEIALEATGNTLRGQVRGLRIELSLEGQLLTGRIGEDAVAINIFAQRQAHGHVGGRELGFTFQPTARGWIVNASLPDVGGRVRVEPEMLAFEPGCDRPLRPVADQPGTYAGACSDETRVTIALPADLMSPMARLVVLGMLLPEPEALLRGKVRGLFPPP